MPLIKHDALVHDPWVAAGDEGPLPVEAHVIVTLERWQDARAHLLARNGRLGIRLRSDQPPALIAEDLDRFDLIALEFPQFKDGRAYSHARLLRARYGFTGELRAVGNVLRDQLVFMQRCGFDAFEVADERALDGWRRATREISVRYQPATDRRPWAAALRRDRLASCRQAAE
jgi:uncharacterized protein (DUF934 family)